MVHITCKLRPLSCLEPFFAFDYLQVLFIVLRRVSFGFVKYNACPEARDMGYGVKAQGLGMSLSYLKPPLCCTPCSPWHLPSPAQPGGGCAAAASFIRPCLLNHLKVVAPLLFDCSVRGMSVVLVQLSRPAVQGDYW